MYSRAFKISQFSKFSERISKVHKIFKTTSATIIALKTFSHQDMLQRSLN